MEVHRAIEWYELTYESQREVTSYVRRMVNKIYINANSSQDSSRENSTHLWKQSDSLTENLNSFALAGVWKNADYLWDGDCDKLVDKRLAEETQHYMEQASIFQETNKNRFILRNHYYTSFVPVSLQVAKDMYNPLYHFPTDRKHVTTVRVPRPLLVFEDDLLEERYAFLLCYGKGGCLDKLSEDLIIHIIRFIPRVAYFVGYHHDRSFNFFWDELDGPHVGLYAALL